MIALALIAGHGPQARPLTGGSTPAPATAAVNSATSIAEQAAKIAKQSQDSLVRATQALQSMQAVQAAARAAAAGAASNIADGLSLGGAGKLPGLVVDPRVSATPNLWINADLPTQSSSDGRTTVTIKQTAPQAVMTWLYYNVSPNTTVVYDQQGNPSWVALNRIDATGSPSRILGQIKADGTVLLINPNGIIFGAGAQINTHSLIASSLDIDATRASSVFNANSAAYTPVPLSVDGKSVTAYVPPNEATANANFVGTGRGQGLFGIASLDGVIGNSAKFSMGNQTLSTAQGGGAIVVERGASIVTSLNSTDDGGYVALLGPNVTNSGSITTPHGQIILAAEGQVVLSAPISSATGSSAVYTLDHVFPSGSAENPDNFGIYGIKGPSLGAAGNVTNDGLAWAQAGAISIGAYDAVTQSGVLGATTSVNRPASISVAAGVGSAGRTSVVFGPNSVTAILPDDGGDTVPYGTATADLQPKITITGQSDFQAGSLLRAPSAAVSLNGLTVLESGATIDVSGLAEVQVPLSKFIVSFLVTPNEIADSPLSSALVGKTVTVDTRLTGTRADGLSWVGSPIVDASGYARLIPKTIGEILTSGGSVTVSGGADQYFIQRPGSIVNLSGGYVTYLGGAVNTTQLIGSDGRFYDIGRADPTIAYVGLASAAGFTVDHARTGTSETFTSPLLDRSHYESSYIAGASAGSLSISILPLLDGTIIGDTVAGLRQRANAIGGGATPQTSLEQLPAGASLTLDRFSTPLPFGFLLETSEQAGADPYGLASYTFGSTSWTPPATVPLLTDRLSETGFGSIKIGTHADKPDGAFAPTREHVNMAEGAILSVAPGGSVSLAGVETIAGSIVAPGGKITLDGYFDVFGKTQNASDVVLGPRAVLDVRGLWINDSGAVGDELQGSAFIDGGSVSIITNTVNYHPVDRIPQGSYPTGIVDETANIILSAGSVIDVSSGGYVGVNGKLKLGADNSPLGKGGSLSLVTYNGRWVEFIPELPPRANTFVAGNVRPIDGGPPTAATVELNGAIYAGGFGAGGTFTLQAPTVIIDGKATSIASYTSGERAGEIVLPSSFFTDNGFSNYVLTSVYGSTTVTAGTKVLLRQSNYLVDDSILSQPTGAIARDFATVGLAPYGLRNPVSLTLAERSYPYGKTGPSTTAGVLLEEGASIVAEASLTKRATINLSADGPVTVLGGITAPGGAISLQNNTSGFADPPAAVQDVWVGRDAVLDVSGVFLPDPTVTAYQTGSAIDAGTISLSGRTIVAEPGSLFRLDGASGTVEIPAGSALGPQLVRQDVWSNGGALRINPSTASYFAGTVSAHGGAPLASGGSLTISGGSIVVEPDGLIGATLASLSDGRYPLTPAELAAKTPPLAEYVQIAFIGADTLNNSGFDSISLQARSQTIAFNGSQSIHMPGSLILGAPTLTLMPGSDGLLPSGVTNPATYVAASCGTGCVPTIGGSRVDLSAGYIWLQQGHPFYARATLADGVLNLTAKWIDVGQPDNGVSGGSDFAFRNVGSATLTSADAIRLMGYAGSNTTSSYSGSLAVAGDLTLAAAEIYPTSGTRFTIKSTSATGTIDIEQTGVASQPLSAGGTLTLDAVNIIQNGTLWAPFGQIVLGNAATTQNVTLGAGSLTSVSGAGSAVPYGFTVDGEAWYVGNAGYNASINNPGYQGDLLTAAPAKAVTLNGANVATSAGATLDLSGGGDIYASEFVAGVGGSRNVLTTDRSGATVYALVPASSAKVAAYDPAFAFSEGPFGQSLLNAQPGTAVYLTGGNGIPAGAYTLMPGLYATLPGAYRVVVASSSVKTGDPQNYTTADGSNYVTGYFANSITGARSSQAMLFRLQSASSWTKYSQIDITSGSAFLRDAALAAGSAIPVLPIDGGALTLAARSTLSLASMNYFAGGASPLAPSLSGVNGQLAVSAAKILVLAKDQAAPAASTGYLLLDADQLSNSGATTLLLGGSSSVDSKGALAVTALATDVEIETDAAHPLSAPQLILASRPGGKGITVDDGSVIAAVGTVPAGGDRPISVTGDGSLLRVSTGSMVDLTRASANAGTGQIAIGTAPGTTTLVSADTAVGVTINGGAALTIDSSGDSRLSGKVALNASAYDLGGGVVNVGGGSAGLALSREVIASFAGATSVRLRSVSVINFYDASGLVIGDADKPIGTLTFDSSGLYGEGGTTTVNAKNIVLTSSRPAPSTANALTGANGALTLSASDTITFAKNFAAGAGAFTFGGFGRIDVKAANAVRFAGAGAGAYQAVNAGGVANVAFATPNMIAAAASVQSFTASGALTTVSSGAPTAVVANETGGSLTLSGASVSVSSTLTALSGTLILDATSGDVALGEGAFVNAGGSRVALGPDIEYAPGGTVRLNALSGNVSIGSGAKVSVAAARDEYGSGYAGSLYITTADTGTTTLSGTLDGSAAFKDTGGNFILNTGRLAGTLPWNGFSRRFSVTLNQPGDLVIGAGETLVSSEVMLVANQGSVIVDGAIDASGVDGKIALYGSGTKSGGVTTGGVAIGATALLDARFVAPAANDPGYAKGTKALVPNGGTITLGTTGRANGTVSTTGCGGSGCGYQNVDSADAGWIDVAAGAQFDVRGGAGGVGGQVTLRAPLLTNNNLNVRFAGTLITSGMDGVATGNGVVLNAYATWSATDPTTAGLSRHFDGIIDPAGWYTSSGTLVAGWTQTLTSSTDATRADIIYTAQAAGGSIAQGAIFTAVNGAVDNTNYAHADFYQKRLVSFVQNPFNGNAAAVAANFSGARQIVLADATKQIDKTAATALAASQLHLRPEISLVNPSKAINGGNISVLSNWNLGGVQTAPVASGVAPLTSYTPAYRTKGPIDPGEPGALSLRAVNNVDIRATISDGFYEAASAFYKTFSGGWQSHSYALVANLIANNPAIATGTAPNGATVRLTEWNTTSAASLMSIGPGNLGSFSYDFVAGAAFGAIAPANPDAVVPVAGAVSPTSPTSSITINGHTSYVGIYSDSGLIRYRTHYIPTLVRTGTGSIRLTAAGNVEFTDTTVQGAVYTAGALAATPADYRPQNFDRFFNTSGYLTQYVGAPNGLESFVYANSFGLDGNRLRQRGFGAGGGSVTIEAGQSIIGFEQTTQATSTPWTAWYAAVMQSDKDSTPFSSCYGLPAGCQSTAYVNYATFFQNFGALGGGSMTLRAGRDVTDISVALPEAIAVAGGFDVFDPPHAIYYGGGNLLAQIGGNLNSSVFFVGRGGARIEVGGAIQQTADNPLTAAKDPTAFPLLLAAQDSYFDIVAAGSVTLRVSDPTSYGDTPFTSYGPQSGLSLTSLGGNVSATGSYLPPNLKIAALKGDITNAGGTMFDLPTDLAGHGVGSLVLAAAGSINAALTLDAPPLTGNTSYINPLGLPSYSLAPESLTNSDPVLVSAGKDVTGALTVDRPAEIIAGRDVTLNFTGVNLDESDVTSIIAGRDIVSATSGVFGSTYGLYGPGAFLLEAGRNIGRKVNTTSFNVSTYGNGSGGGLIPNTTQPVPLKSYLPAKGADIYVLYGIANGVDYASAISAYVDPASAGANGIDFLADIAGVLGLPRDQAWAAFQGLSPTRQQLLVDRAFLDFLTQVATDYRNPASPYYAKYGRAYEAIGTLFPKGLGYANDGSGGADPAAVGRLTMPFSLIETQLGGDINIIGPVGGIKVGSAGRDNKKPYEEGILTLRGGTIRIYTDQSVLVNQSRIMTLQGGDVNIFSGNGDILAGSGPKTYVSNPVLQLVCAYYSGYCAVNPQGLVTGAGIGAILTLPSLDPDGSNATLAVPRGTVDAGAAGIRVAGNLNIVAQHVANVYNIQVQGNVSGLQPPPPGPNVAALTAGSNQAGAGAKAVETPRAGNDGSDAPSLITVEILGYGGSDRGEPAERSGAEPEEERRRRGAR
ncbi:filamentous haemagglutinin family protein [Methylosinus sp. Ce-a6]|uniref:filamentous haemagglutinin family protein n=1 Tax=Methylosinus sp. Ce-a6 TaxID=2172005 RepID=UPI0013569420|nr:filamentous haemagglutinin family protein [Methylosinus sp. Ce-a6]